MNVNISWKASFQYDDDSMSPSLLRYFYSLLSEVNVIYFNRHGQYVKFFKCHAHDGSWTIFYEFAIRTSDWSAITKKVRRMYTTRTGIMYDREKDGPEAVSYSES
jgi:hypothetical protein